MPVELTPESGSDSRSPVTVAEFKTHARVPFNDDDAYIGILLEAATLSVEKITGRTMLTDVLVVKLCELEDECIRLPRRPLQSVASIEYLDASGATLTVDPSVYVLDRKRGHIHLAWGQVWPLTLDQPEAVTITCSVGYGVAADVPSTLKQAVYQLAGLWYAQREPIISGAIVAEVPFSLRTLLMLEKAPRA